MLDLKTKADLDDLVARAIPEGITLVYRASGTPSEIENGIDALCMDVSALANSSGGRIVYGIARTRRAPMDVDAGIDGTAITAEWLVQVIGDRIRPVIRDVGITAIPLWGNRVAYVIAVPQATTLAPHQAPDRKYYRRSEVGSVPMADHEVREAFRRATAPSLMLDVGFGDGTSKALLQPQVYEENQSQPLTILFDLLNETSQPADHTTVSIYVRSILLVSGFGEFAQASTTVASPKGARCRVFTQTISTARGDLPVFKEAPVMLSGGLTFRLGSGMYLTTLPNDIAFGYRIQSPGFDITKWGYLSVEGQALHIKL